MRLRRREHGGSVTLLPFFFNVGCRGHSDRGHASDGSDSDVLLQVLLVQQAVGAALHELLLLQDQRSSSFSRELASTLVC